jgi:hypothetical protein
MSRIKIVSCCKNKEIKMIKNDSFATIYPPCCDAHHIELIKESKKKTNREEFNQRRDRHMKAQQQQIEDSKTSIWERKNSYSYI